MPAPSKPSCKPAAPANPCVACGEREHNRIPDADLGGYLCAACARLLRDAKKIMAKAGISGCTPDRA